MKAATPAAFYIDNESTEQGPIGVGDLARLARSGAISRDTMVWFAGMPDWRPAGQVNELASLFAAPAPSAPESSPASFGASPPPAPQSSPASPRTIVQGLALRNPITDTLLVLSAGSAVVIIFCMLLAIGGTPLDVLDRSMLMASAPWFAILYLVGRNLDRVKKLVARPLLATSATAVVVLYAAKLIVELFHL